ncbi:MAG: NAD(P)/FAD-dependent oxidoreductase [Bacteroidales bacterium]|nr:NAD(P)/FAD-dependent oxidoreductase [Bacteroidales bacterium]
MDTKIVIIGAGVVGLAIAERLSRYYDGVFVVEKHKKFGQETSSRNSEVIHSGIYYPEGSLKARLCVQGRDMLYWYCRNKEVLHRQCGKYIVATNEEESQELESVLQQARGNGVESGRILDQDDLKSYEPHVTGIRALYFETSGIVDTHGLMKQLETDAVVGGTQMAYESRVTGLRRIEGGYEVELEDASGKFVFTTEAVINSAGLEAYEVSRMAGMDDLCYRLHFWKGQYWSIGNGKHKMINSLIYPVPQARLTGLGIHATVDLNGGVKLGPDAVYLEDGKLDYSVDPSSGHAFYKAARRFLPFLEPDDLHPDQAGIRPKLQKPGDSIRDFIIREEGERGFPHFINLIGIESPGLTASLAIAEYVAKLLKLG